MEKIELGTPDGAMENIERLAELFPQVVTEVQNEDGGVERAVDFDALRDLLGDVAEGNANATSSRGRASARPRPKRAVRSSRP